tara:strand:+ start:129 stop:431 length:303 start_codon:yes stop_codon:yes gene_type:complete
MRLDLTECMPVNHLWKDLLDSLGIEKANQAVRQAIDLQLMHGNKQTLPVLFIQTGGIALTTFEFLKQQTGFSFYGKNKVLLYSPRKKFFQILHELKASNQ